MKPSKPLAFESLMKRDPKQWAHWAQSLGAAIMFWPPPLFQAARANTQLQCENILKTKMKPFKSQAFESLMKRDPKQWAHWAQPLGAAIMDQVTSNGTSRTSHSRSCSW